MIDLTKKLYLDGGMGSLLIERANLEAGYPLEKLNYENPLAVKQIHEEYLDSGSDIIYTNTFGANGFKYGKSELEKVIRTGIMLANDCARSKGKYTALDIGQLGKIIGEGGISEKDAYDAFKEIILLAADKTDLIVIETMTNLAEARIATLAAKENSNLPIMVSMTFEQNMRSVFGTPIECFCDIISNLGVAALGINCALGAKEMLPLAKKLSILTDKPLFIKPNAGMPSTENGKTIYHTDAEEFSLYASNAFSYGINIVGGCCGTTPEFIRKTKEKGDLIPIKAKNVVKKSAICSSYKHITVDRPLIVGERINPTGKKLFQQALKNRDWGYILNQALEQEDQGADILDVNVGMGGINEPEVMEETVKKLQTVTVLPLIIDSSNLDALERGLRAYHGKAVINSVNGKEESMNSVLPLAKKYGSAIIGLTIDENGISADIDKRVGIAEKIIARCREYGIPCEDIYIDTLTMAEAAQKGNALTTLGALKSIKKLGVKTVLGISNISFGMPNRMDINARFMEMALENGLDLCLINPVLKNMLGSFEAGEFLLNKENAAENYIKYAQKNSLSIQENNFEEKNLSEVVLRGQKELAYDLTISLLKTKNPTEIINAYLIPALDKLGDLYGSGEVFLPQLIAGAEAAKSAFTAIETLTDRKTESENKRFVIATVKGDIHDIGKNIVKIVVSNYGFKVIDLGKDVDYQKIIDAVKENYPCVLGLSALMTTTAENMAKTIKLVKEKYDIPILTGGAVLTKEYSEKIGGIYCADANETVKTLKRIFK